MRRLWGRQTVAVLLCFLTSLFLFAVLKEHPTREADTGMVVEGPLTFQVPAPLPVVKPAAPEPATPPAKTVYSTYRPRKRLMSVAIPVVRVTNKYRTHFWLSNTQLLLITSHQTREQDIKSDPESWRGTADVINPLTKKRTRLVGLTRLLNQIEGTPGWFRLSPNRRWLEWINFQTGDSWPIPVVAHLNGTGFQQLDQDKFSQTLWLDNRHWAEVEARPEEVRRLIVHNVETRTKTDFRLSSQQAQKLLRRRHNASLPIFDSTYDGSWVGIAKRVWGVSELDEREIARTGKYSIHLPQNTHVNQVLINKQGKQAIYVVSLRTKSGKVYTDLWTSRMNGSHLHELGYLPEEHQDNSPFAWMSLQWLPDGKRISFVYNAVLYIVPIK